MSPDSELVGSDVLHVHVHGVELNTNDLGVFESAGLAKMEQIACRSGKMGASWISRKTIWIGAKEVPTPSKEEGHSDRPWQSHLETQTWVSFRFGSGMDAGSVQGRVIHETVTQSRFFL